MSGSIGFSDGPALVTRGSGAGLAAATSSVIVWFSGDWLISIAGIVKVSGSIGFPDGTALVTRGSGAGLAAATSSAIVWFSGVPVLSVRGPNTSGSGAGLAVVMSSSIVWFSGGPALGMRGSGTSVVVSTLNCIGFGTSRIVSMTLHLTDC